MGNRFNALTVGQKVLDGFAKRRARVNAATVGQKVLDGLAKGRARRISKAREERAKNAMQVVILFNADRDAGRPMRGRAGRISRKLRGELTERYVLKIISAFRIGRADSLR
jgi:hypothetical protein